MPSDAVVALRTGFSIDDPWRRPAAAVPISLSRATDGRAPHLTTTVVLHYDQDYLSVIFSGSDDHVAAGYWNHDDPLYEEDVFEVFLAPIAVTDYYEVEVSPNGTVFDAHIVSPEGSRDSMHVDRAWDAGAISAVRTVREQNGMMTIDTLLRIPFAALGATAPEGGERWRANFFRIDRHPERGDEYSAWRPTLRTPPDFHVPAAFGEIEFR